MEVVVTLFMLVMLLVLFSIIALLWCFRGFSRELKHPRKPVG
jgi:flagellar biogenesis protein FliO